MKLVVVIMGQNCERFIGMCLDSIKDADAIVYCDGGSDGGFWDYWNDELMPLCPEKDEDFVKVIENKYSQDDEKMNGKQRNFYLDYIKKNYPDDWCLCLDADEIVEDLSKIKTMIQEFKEGLYSIKMRHLIGDLGHEDSCAPIHFVQNRLFKVSCADKYPEIEHPVLQPKEGVDSFNVMPTTIWHLAYMPGMWDIKKRYDSHLKKSSIHTPQYLNNWYKAHLFGQYPKTPINIIELPDQLLNEFGIDKDELYFAGRGIEMKHALQVKQWRDYFKPNNVMCLGCGLGPYLYFWNWFTDAWGMELSNYAIENAFIKDKILQGDISVDGRIQDYDLITAVDVFEHLTYKQLDKTLKNLKKYGKQFLFSIPFIGDANLEADKTHIIKENKEWWIKKLGYYGIKVTEPPSDWLFKEQILIGNI